MFVEIQNGRGVANDAFIVKIKPVLKKDVKGLEDRLMEMYSLEDIHFMGFKVGGGGKPAELDAGVWKAARAVLVQAMSDNRLAVEEAKNGYAIMRRGQLVNEYKFVAKCGGGVEDMSDRSDRNGLYFLPEHRWNEVLMYKVEMSDGSTEYMSEQEYADFKYKAIGFKEA